MNQSCTPLDGSRCYWPPVRSPRVLDIIASTLCRLRLQLYSTSPFYPAYPSCPLPGRLALPAFGGGVVQESTTQPDLAPCISSRVKMKPCRYAAAMLARLPIHSREDA